MLCTQIPREDETNSPAATPRQKERKRFFKPFQIFRQTLFGPMLFYSRDNDLSQLDVVKRRNVVSSFRKIMHLECRASTGTEELHHQFRTVPEREGLLVNPVQRFREQLQVEVPQELSKQETHLCVRKAVDKMLANTARYSSGESTDGMSR